MAIEARRRRGSPPGFRRAHAAASTRLAPAASTRPRRGVEATTPLDDAAPPQLIHAKLDDDYGGGSSRGLKKDEWQLLECDATGGSFTLSFDGLTTRSISYNANAATVQAALQELSNINTVTVQLVGSDSPTTACVDGGESRVDFSNFDDYGGSDTLNTFSAGINITFTSVTDYVGDVPALVAHTNELEGMRRAGRMGEAWCVCSGCERSSEGRVDGCIVSLVVYVIMCGCVYHRSQ